MLAAIVRASLAQSAHHYRALLLIAVLGAAALFVARFDVFPDFAPPHVLVQTEAPGLDATQVEALVTRPLEGLLAGTENVADGALDFEPGPVGDPGGVRPRRRSVPAAPGRHRAPGRGRAACCPRAPDRRCCRRLSSSMEYLVHFGYTSDRLSPLELRDLVRWIVKPQILAVPGVAQAQIFGGECASGRCEVDPFKLAARGLTLDDVYARDAPRHRADRRRLYRDADAAHRDAGAGRRARPLEALAQAVIADAQRQLPVRLGDVATVTRWQPSRVSAMR